MARFFKSKLTERPEDVTTGPKLYLINSEWTPVGTVREFPLQQPKIIFVKKYNFQSKKSCNRPLYVLQRRRKEFVVVDLNTYGEYEYRVKGENLYVRRLVTGTG